MPPIIDTDVREQALDLGKSFIVQSPAGSGKTGLLIQRILGLLGVVQYPEQILAMTFTRKAAGEMKSRIIDALLQAQNNATPETDHQRKTWELARKALLQNQKQGWQLLENPSRLKVQTIDSFCSGLTRQMPVMSQMGGVLSILENASELYRETAQRVLALVESQEPIGDAVRIILKHLDNQKSAFLKRIIQLLEKRDQWMIPFFQKFQVTEESRAYLEKTLAGVIENVLQETSALIPSQIAERLPRLASFSGQSLAIESPHHAMACLKDLTELPSPSIHNLEKWKAISQLLLTQSGDFRKTVNKGSGFPAGKTGSEEQKLKKEFVDLLQDLSGEVELHNMFREIQNLPQPRFTNEEWNVLEATLNLLPEIAATLRRIFAEHQKTDFTEISLSALKALGKEDDPTDLLLYLDTRIQHILVDEYQDTSFKQHELLKLLTAGWEREDGRSLFIVGDPMQSIYRFRDAEVGLFLRTQREGIGQIQLESLSLKTNFRSQRKIVDWVNACFGKVFPRESNEDLGAISYSDSSAALPEYAFPGTVLHPVHVTGDTQATQREEARQIAALIDGIRKNDPEQSIAILVRARNHLAEIVRCFREQGVTFKAEEIDPLTARPAILDLLALMRALLNPWDRISWLSILRAPWCGLSLSDLHRLCETDSDTSILQLLQDSKRFSALSEDGQRRLERLFPVMQQTLDSLASSNFRELLEGCWVNLGGPACVDESTLEDVEVFFDEITSTIENGNWQQLQNFHRVLEHLYANPAISEENTVQIMTMHKAKGLEFDTVILPGLGKPPKMEEKRLVYWIPHKNDLLLGPIEEKGGQNSQVYDFISRLDREKDNFETLRLLYVAATRARKQLHLFGHLKQTGKTPAPSKNSLLDKLWPYLETEWRQLLSEQVEEVSTPDTDTETLQPGHTTQRLPLSFKTPEPFPDIEVGAVIEMTEEPDLHPEFVWAGNKARYLGNVLHLCFKKITDEGLEYWPASATKNLESRIKTALLAEGLSPAHLDEAVQSGMTALQNTLQDETGRWILKAHADAHSEYPLTGYIQGRYLNKILDRTFVDADGVRWIVDYKTGEHQGSRLEDFFQQEKKRYQAQLDQYEELLKLKGETRPIKKALYYPLYKRLVEI